ncbi:sugar ABC transporter permease [Candidatus Acidianus copahuensis]|uniref:Sugar ABC transporter permease n=1 Tax=Candidatus Acidianus copahuensis TaxID=1160895 RepID=A0A031LU53_9CREN|nr:glucose ABC transporter permease GlcT [Candidatus Acidianus copahuensis]EZQ11356.1 sugar ABC transporter permease [Candidatus Acidianus copahuensis]
MKKTSFLLILPTAIFGAILLYIVFYNVAISFTNWSLLHPIPSFSGISSYANVIHSFYFPTSLIHSLELSGSAVIFGNILGIGIAGLLYFLSSNKARTFFLSIIILPLAISMAVNALIWLWLYNYNLGVNWLFLRLGLPYVPWLTSTSMMMPSIIIIAIWAYTGLPALFYLASFLGIDKSIIEAARLDGASSFKILRKILIPNSANGFIVSTALLFLFTFRIFSIPYILSGGPTNIFMQTLVVFSYYLFTTEFFAQASALSTIIILIATAIVIPYALYGIKRWIKK